MNLVQKVKTLLLSKNETLNMSGDVEVIENTLTYIAKEICTFKIVVAVAEVGSITETVYIESSAFDDNCNEIVVWKKESSESFADFASFKQYIADMTESF